MIGDNKHRKSLSGNHTVHTYMIQCHPNHMTHIDGTDIQDFSQTSGSHLIAEPHSSRISPVCGMD